MRAHTKEEIKCRTGESRRGVTTCPRRHRDLARPGQAGARSLCCCSGTSLLPTGRRGKPFSPAVPAPGTTAAAPRVSPAPRAPMARPGLPLRRRAELSPLAVGKPLAGPPALLLEP